MVLSDLSKVVFISGTPCTGKTTIANELNSYLNNNGFYSRLIRINEFATENNLIIGEDPDKFYKIIDIERLNEVLSEEIATFKEGNPNSKGVDLSNGSDDVSVDSDLSRILIVEGHVSHLCEGADKMIVLRLDPEILKTRLEARDYSNSKIQENLEAEALAVCSAEAYELYDKELNEIDTSDKSIDEVLDVILDILLKDSNYPVGSVDFMNWLLL